MYEDLSNSVIHWNLYDECTASTGAADTHSLNMKDIQRHGSRSRVKTVSEESFSDGAKIYTWSNDKRDIISNKIAAE